MKIAIFGATGMLGRPVVHELLGAGHTLSALVRSKEKAEQVLPTQVKLVQGDLKTGLGVAETVEGCDVVYFSLANGPSETANSWHVELDGIQTVLQAISGGSVKRVAYLSSLIMNYDGFQWWNFEVKKRAAQAILQADVPATVFYPSAFMETLRDRQLQGKNLNTAGEAVEKMHWIAGQDYGKMVAADVNQPGSDNREWVVQGPEAHTQTEAAKVFAEHYPQPIKVRHAPLGMLRFFGLFSSTLRQTAKVIEAINNMPEPFRGQPAWDHLHKPTVTLKQFAQATPQEGT